MIADKFKEIITNNPKLIANAFVIENSYPKNFIFGEMTNSTITIHFHKNNFKKLLKKLDLEYLPVIFKITYIGYGVIGKIVGKDEKGNPKIKYSFFAARRASFFPKDYDDYQPGDKVEINYIAIPYLILPSLSVSLPKLRELNEGDIANVFVIHEYQLEALTEIGGREIPLFKHSWYPNVAFPPFSEENKNYYDELIDFVKMFYNKQEESYYFETRKDVAIIEATIKEKPLKLVIISPYSYTEKVEEKTETQKLIKTCGFGNVKSVVKLGKTNRVLENLANLKLNFKLEEMFPSAIKIVLGKYADIDNKDKIVIRVVTGRIFMIGSEIITITEEWSKETKFSAKALKKRKEEKIGIKIPKVGTSIIYKPDREDVRSMKEILLDQEVEILRTAEFDQILEEYEKNGIATEHFNNGFKMFPYVKVQLLVNDKQLFEQVIPYIYSIKIIRERKK